MRAGAGNVKRLDRPPRRSAYIRSFCIASAIIATALLIGICGYALLNDEPWIDALVDASMILSGMGPVSPLKYPAAKIFASFYALMSGLVLVGTSAILLGPWIHRLLHRLHADEKDLR